MGGLKILITNHTLAVRAGTELYVRDIALGLLARGHTPIVYTTRIGEVGHELRKATVPVIDDLNSLAETPDLIHGQHHAEAMTALLHFQGVPAVFFCHGWLPDEEAPPLFPRILRYVAVDDTCRDRLMLEHGISEERVRVLLNFVDLERFRSRGPLPERPRRALLFSNNASEATHLAAVREACDRNGLELDVLGSASGNESDQPETVLGQYDLVFAKARCALEALAVGSAVVLCDTVGSGLLVTTEDFARLRRLNFGIRALPNDVTPETLSLQISRYDAADAMEVSREVRSLAGREAAIDDLIATYEEVLSEHRGRVVDSRVEGRAAADYLRKVTTDIRRERETMRTAWEEFQNSTTGRLRNSLVRSPRLGALAESLAKKLSR